MVKQEQQIAREKIIEAKIDKVLDFVRVGNNATKPAGWPSFPLLDRTAHLEFEIFLNDRESYDFAVSICLVYR